MFDARNGKVVFDKVYDAVTDFLTLPTVYEWCADDWWDDIPYQFSRFDVDREKYSDLMAYVYAETENKTDSYDSYGYCLFTDGFQHAMCCMVYDRYWCKFYNETIERQR